MEASLNLNLSFMMAWYWPFLSWPVSCLCNYKLRKVVFFLKKILKAKEKLIFWRYCLIHCRFGDKTVRDGKFPDLIVRKTAQLCEDIRTVRHILNEWIACLLNHITIKSFSIFQTEKAYVYFQRNSVWIGIFSRPVMCVIYHVLTEPLS